jgi:hypothetical protein
VDAAGYALSAFVADGNFSAALLAAAQLSALAETATASTATTASVLLQVNTPAGSADPDVALGISLAACPAGDCAVALDKTQNALLVALQLPALSTDGFAADTEAAVTKLIAEIAAFLGIDPALISYEGFFASSSEALTPPGGSAPHRRLLARAGRVQALRLDAAERALTPRCPRCRTAFAGFDGCFALQCAPSEERAAAAVAAAAAARRTPGAAPAGLTFCGASFCGWCTAECGAGVHAHVAGCAHNLVGGGSLYGARPLWEEAQRRWKRRSMSAYLARLEAPLRVPLRAAMRSELAELGMA